MTVHLMVKQAALLAQTASLIDLLRWIFLKIDGWHVWKVWFPSKTCNIADRSSLLSIAYTEKSARARAGIRDLVVADL